jgi:hypothetical protein
LRKKKGGKNRFEKEERLETIGLKKKKRGTE